MFYHAKNDESVQSEDLSELNNDIVTNTINKLP